MIVLYSVSHFVWNSEDNRQLFISSSSFSPSCSYFIFGLFLLTKFKSWWISIGHQQQKKREKMENTYVQLYISKASSNFDARASLVTQMVKNLCVQGRRPGFDPWVKKITWRREWLPTPVFLPGEFHGQRRLASHSPWGCKESDTTKWLTLSLQFKTVL